MPSIVDFGFYLGEDYTQEFDVVGCDGVTPLDISGWTIVCTAATYNDPTFPTLFTLNAVLNDPTQGKCTVTFPRSATRTLPARTYVYALSETNTGADASLVTGYLQLSYRAR